MIANNAVTKKLSVTCMLRARLGLRVARMITNNLQFRLLRVHDVKTVVLDYFLR